jgi:hypothetical protein
VAEVEKSGEFVLLYDAGKKQEESEKLVPTSTPVLHRSICVTDVSYVLHISRVTSDLVWVCDDSNLVLTDTTGVALHHVTDVSSGYGVHTVGRSGELIYIDSNYDVKQLSVENETTTTLLQGTFPWEASCVYCSPTNGDLFLGIKNVDENNPYRYGIVYQFNSTGQQLIQTIQNDNTGLTLYNVPKYITKNRNGDVIVSDCDTVVVTECWGRHRFSYSGPPSATSFLPGGICTDTLSHILVCDRNSHTVQMIDKDGHFLSLLLTSQHKLNIPLSLNYDDKISHLWVGSEDSNMVSVYRYMERGHSRTGKYY